MPFEQRPGVWKTFWQSVVKFDREKLTPVLAARNTIGVALPLAVGVATGAISGGVAVSTGALNVSFSDSYDPYPVRARRMLATSVLVGLAVFAGGLCGRDMFFAVGLAGGWAFAAGMLVALSPAAADLGVISLVTLLVYASGSLDPQRAMYSGLLALGGGLLQTVLSLALWPLRRYIPQRRMLGELFLELARIAAESHIDASEAPPASTHATQAHTALSVLDRDASVESERYRLLLSQAERMRLGIIGLRRIRARLRREDAGAPELDAFFDLAAKLATVIGSALVSGKLAIAECETLERFEGAADAMQPTELENRPVVAALVRDARHQMEALAGQVRAAFDLTASAAAGGDIAFARREAGRPWRLRLSGTVATLRANLHLQSAAFRHALRLAVCVAFGGAVGRMLDVQRAYWLPMTIAIVLKPDFTATFSRGVLRLAGTFAGLVLATALVHVLPAGGGWEVGCIALLMLAMRWVGGANYGIFVTAVTGLVVILFALSGVAPRDVIAARGANTAAGGAIALLAYALWPTWERTQVSESMARLLDAYRDYFRAIRDGYEHPDRANRTELDRTRLEARLARSNLEASVYRLIAEPGTPERSISTMGGMLASSHRLVHALMSLESGLSLSQPVPARAAFRGFSNVVELTMHSLAAALRGSTLRPEELPDLREAHRALVQSGNALVERYALVNVETDRVTNSLNTLAGELFRWIET